MSEIELASLNDVAISEIVALMNNELVGQQMPLLAQGFSEAQCEAFLQAKNKLWEDHGYGPWAFLISGEFAGWGGLQEEQGEADFALVLHPDYWGWGRRIFERVKVHAFEQLEMESITILFPPSRTNYRAVARFGFVEDGELLVDRERFMRFRLRNTTGE